MNRDGYTEFRMKIHLDTRITFEASGSAYAVAKALEELGQFNALSICISSSVISLSGLVSSSTGELPKRITDIHL